MQLEFKLRPQATTHYTLYQSPKSKIKSRSIKRLKRFPKTFFLRRYKLADIQSIAIGALLQLHKLIFRYFKLKFCMKLSNIFLFHIAWI